MAEDTPPQPNKSLRDQYEELARSSSSLPDVFDFLANHPTASPREVADVVLADLTFARECGAPRPAQLYFNRLRVLADDAELRTEIIERDFELQHASGETIDVDSYLMQFSEVPARLSERLRQTQVQPRSAGTAEPASPGVRHPRTSPASPTLLPARIGRYAVRRVIGSGKFGTVFEAFDERLQRSVAIKQPHRGSLSAAERETFAAEARHLAQLNHPGIVAVYDFGETADANCYVVTQWIDGETLAAALRQRQFSWKEACSLMLPVAEALHYAHCRQIVHRDLKPANILLDRGGQPYVADFGLALNDDQLSRAALEAAGTPAYMSPEQVLGEVRYLDGRSDLWSLGVILYELLTGQRPFRGDTIPAIGEEILKRDPKPLRLLNPSIPAELERLCLKCLEKDRTRRLPTAADLVAGLRQCLTPGERLPGWTPSSEDFRIVSTTCRDEDGFPIVTATVLNRTPAPQVVIAVRADVTAFRAIRGPGASRVLMPEMRADVAIPCEPGSQVTPLARPVFVAPQDALSLEMRLVCLDAAGLCRSPNQAGSFRCRLTLITDLSWETSTDELSMGRGAG